MITHRLRAASQKAPDPSFNLVASISDSFNVPAETQIGDIIIVSSYQTNSGLTAPTNRVPVGWTQISTNTGGYSVGSFPTTYYTSRQTIIYKIADSNGSFTISSSSIVWGGFESGITILVLRPITGSVTSVVANQTTGNSINTSGATGKVIVIVDYIYGLFGGTFSSSPVLISVGNSVNYLRYSSALTGGTVWTVSATGTQLISTAYLEVT